VQCETGFATIVKMRVIADRQQVVRVDWEGAPLQEGGMRRRLLARTVRLADASTGVVLSDYGKGVLDQTMIDAVLATVHRTRRPVGMDPKDTHHLQIAGITVATPNCREAHVCAGLPARSSIPGDPLNDMILRNASDILLEKWQADQLVITLGAQGMFLAAPGSVPEVIPTHAREVFDVSGAGDTVIATCLLALAAGANRREAAMLGNFAAGVVVGKLGTACCTPDELLAAIRENQRSSAI
jgi:D-beta-D-heptose 7-phosphate kinase/D-beta-D-heptose 1-phosphate adenosyltransferase